VYYNVAILSGNACLGGHLWSQTLPAGGKGCDLAPILSASESPFFFIYFFVVSMTMATAPSAQRAIELLCL
jgi:hypothetical protein